VMPWAPIGCGGRVCEQRLAAIRMRAQPGILRLLTRPRAWLAAGADARARAPDGGRLKPAQQPDPFAPPVAPARAAAIAYSVGPPALRR
jgi:hypothetical protein